jgi:hypothetical protein
MTHGNMKTFSSIKELLAILSREQKLITEVSVNVKFCRINLRTR